jgi:hypothetical protein
MTRKVPTLASLLLGAASAGHGASASSVAQRQVAAGVLPPASISRTAASVAGGRRG